MKSKKNSSSLQKTNTALEANRKRLLEREKTPTFIENKKGEISLKEEEDLSDTTGLLDATATEALNFAYYLSGQLAITAKNEVRTMNAGLAFLHGMKPKDEIEALLMSQLFSLQTLTMQFSRRALQEERDDICERNANRVAKLTGRFAELVNALQKYRGVAQQKVTVEHVTVNEGGQAIVGNVTGGGSDGKIK